MQLKTSALKLSVLGLLLLPQQFFTSCKQDFVGLSVRKPVPTKEPSNPREIDFPRKNEPTRRVSGSGEGGGTTTIPAVERETISLNVVQASSESWWKNCLYAKTPYSNGWIFVACNKDSQDNRTSVSLPAAKGVCNAISLKIDTYKNQGSTCADRARLGQSCEGPYAQQPDASQSPQSDSFGTSQQKSSAYSLYSVESVDSPDPLITSNSNWQLPNFQDLKAQMAAWAGTQGRNQWIRVFFEDQPSTAIARARQSAAEQRKLGIDYNDYVFDLKSEGVSFTIANSGRDCSEP